MTSVAAAVELPVGVVGSFGVSGRYIGKEAVMVYTGSLMVTGHVVMGMV